MEEDGSKGLCVDIREVQRCCMWVKLRGTWLKPCPSGIHPPNVGETFQSVEG